jgi:DNA repair exonuclease SbcCD ATPase subunit
MSKLQDVYRSIQEKKKRKKELESSFKDELRASGAYEKLADELKVLREKKKAFENDIRSRSAKDAQELDELKAELASEQEVLADMALNAYVKGETVQVVDDYDNKWVPQFKVSFKKE